MKPPRKTNTPEKKWYTNAGVTPETSTGSGQCHHTANGKACRVVATIPMAMMRGTKMETPNTARTKQNPPSDSTLGPHTTESIQLRDGATHSAWGVPLSCRGGGDGESDHDEGEEEESDPQEGR